MMKKLVWRLGKLPSPDEVRELVKDKIITQEEARDILFNLETEESRDKKSLESEIKFLRELVEKLSNSRSHTTEVIRQIWDPYRHHDWYRPYVTWCSSTGMGSTTTATAGYVSTNANNSITLGGTNAVNLVSSGSGTSNFSDIKTF